MRTQGHKVVNLHNKQTNLSHADWSKTQPGPKQSLVTRHMCQALQHVCGLHHGQNACAHATDVAPSAFMYISRLRITSCNAPKRQGYKHMLDADRER